MPGESTWFQVTMSNLMFEAPPAMTARGMNGSLMAAGATVLRRK